MYQKREVLEHLMTTGDIAICRGWWLYARGNPNWPIEIKDILKSLTFLYYEL